MMMSRSLFIAAAWTIRHAVSFITSSSTVAASSSIYPSFIAQHRSSSIRHSRKHFQSSAVYFSSSSSSSETAIISFDIENNVSRLSTLQTLLSKHGAPGSVGCQNGNDDLIPILSSSSLQEQVPELITTMEGEKTSSSTTSVELINRFDNLHPYLFPIAQSQSTGNVICAYRNPMMEDYDKYHPWPIVETKVGSPGFRLLALNSEHIMRRIVCECDDIINKKDNNDNNDEEYYKYSINLYNEGLGQGFIKDSKLDAPYIIGSVKQLGYGPEKYILLRVGPFPDLYESMVRQHYQRGDEQSALIAAEASNTKFSGFGSTFRFYSRVLSSLPNRSEECRDAARMCLRMPLYTIGIDYQDLEEVAIFGQMIQTYVDDTMISTELVVEKLKTMRELMKSVEAEEDPQTSGKTPSQIILEEANAILDEAVLEKKDWKSIRPHLSQHFQLGGKDDLAHFVSLFSNNR